MSLPVGGDRPKLAPEAPGQLISLLGVYASSTDCLDLGTYLGALLAIYLAVNTG
jgi:hypothetical protein